MNINGEYRVPARRETIWNVLRDPLTLRACLPGCEEVTQVGDDVYEGRIAIQVGAVNTVYSGRATIDDATFPDHYVVSAHFHSPTGGFADGVATVTLVAEPDGTLVGYRARLSPGGRLTSVGERLLRGVAIRLANTFFSRLIERLKAEVNRAAPLDRAVPKPLPHVVVLQPIALTAAPLRVAPSAHVLRSAMEPPPTPPRNSSPMLVVVGSVLWLLILALLFWPQG